MGYAGYDHLAYYKLEIGPFPAHFFKPILPVGNSWRRKRDFIAFRFANLAERKLGMLLVFKVHTLAGTIEHSPV